MINTSKVISKEGGEEKDKLSANKMKKITEIFKKGIGAIEILDNTKTIKSEEDLKDIGINEIPAPK